jgi:AcrR family transcriptional regulator
MANKVSSKSKEEIFWSVFEAVIQLEATKGFGKWKVTDLSRLSKVSRPLIYYYFGKSKESILETAVDFMGEEYFGLSDARMKMWDQGQLVESILISRRMCQKAPYGLLFYMTRRNMQNSIGERMREFEKRYRKKLAEFFPQLAAVGNDGMAGVIFGLVTFPDLTEDGVVKSIQFIQNKLL